MLDPKSSPFAPGAPLGDPVRRPFRVQVSDEVLDDLRKRLLRTRWPDEIPGGGWQYGTRLDYLQELVRYWLERFDWRRQEARLNQLPQELVSLDGLDLHVVHVPGVGPDPLPLLVAHGWPSSVWELYRLIPLLTDPGRFGGDPRDAFTVVAPSLPGHGFSFRPGQRRLGIVEIAELYAVLMGEVYGYQRFGAQGGDWGAFVAARLALTHPDRLAGIHLSLLPLPRDAPPLDEPSDEIEQYRQQLERWQREETGYIWIQGTRPQTLAYGLTDSPAGLAAWIVEKLRAWSDCGGDLEWRFSKDDVLTTVMLYWATEAINSSFWPYYARLQEPWPIPAESRIGVLTAYARFPADIIHQPRAWAERVFDLRRWTEMPRGGHFAAHEEPELRAEDVQTFFRELRRGGSATADRKRGS